MAKNLSLEEQLFQVINNEVIGAKANLGTLDISNCNCCTNNMVSVPMSLLYTIALSSWFVGNADGKRSMFKELTKSINNSVYKKQLANATTDETGKLLPNYIHK